jgi:hypothetical protein
MLGKTEMIVDPAEKTLCPIKSLATPTGAVQIDSEEDNETKPFPVHDVRAFSSELREQTETGRATSQLTWPSVSNLDGAESPAR